MKGCLDGVEIKWGKEIGLLWRKESKGTNKLFLKKMEKVDVKERKERK